MKPSTMLVGASGVVVDLRVLAVLCGGAFTSPSTRFERRTD
jgi:hypothetical protein